MEYKPHSKTITPRLIIHGGAGNITPDNLPPERYNQYHEALLSIICNTHQFLISGNNALETVTFAVERLENNPLFNSGKGAVFTRDGINELESSIMVSRGKKKRGVGLMGLRHVKNPIRLAREMLIRGENDLEERNGRSPPFAQQLTTQNSIAEIEYSRGAQGHCQLHGEGAERLAREWSLEMVDPGYFFTQIRWDEHVRGLEREKEGTGLASWDAQDYIPQGTCGAVALDAEGVCAVATSTGGITNKLSGRIGDTPTLGAGFWAEEWEEAVKGQMQEESRTRSPVLVLSETLKGFMADCLPGLTLYSRLSPEDDHELSSVMKEGDKVTRSTALSGTGNGDSFLRMGAARTASAITRYRGKTSLRTGVHEITGPGGELQKSAGDRWRKTGEGQGGMIGIECMVVASSEGTMKHAATHIVADYNCGGMFRAEVDRNGRAVVRVWRPGQYEGLDRYPGEGKEYDVRGWLDEKSA